ncbi:hypothetical protein BY458DRAFT_551494 [Sporodiniella umbellata]|nr:hypothetical protein BY458DRAFT_551494 [Sporodiniella umbellata]
MPLKDEKTRKTKASSESDRLRSKEIRKKNRNAIAKTAEARVAAFRAANAARAASTVTTTPNRLPLSSSGSASRRTASANPSKPIKLKATKKQTVLSLTPKKLERQPLTTTPTNRRMSLISISGTEAAFDLSKIQPDCRSVIHSREDVFANNAPTAHHTPISSCPIPPQDLSILNTSSPATLSESLHTSSVLPRTSPDLSYTLSDPSRTSCASSVLASKSAGLTKRNPPTLFMKETFTKKATKGRDIPSEKQDTVDTRPVLFKAETEPRDFDEIGSFYSAQESMNSEMNQDANIRNGQFIEYLRSLPLETTLGDIVDSERFPDIFPPRNAKLSEKEKGDFTDTLSAAWFTEPMFSHQIAVQEHFQEEMKTYFNRTKFSQKEVFGGFD